MLFADVSDFMVQPVPRKLNTKEDLISLDNQSLSQNERQDILARNIYFLELALVMPFANPIKALIRITNETQYQKYQLAIEAHINNRLADQYTQYGLLYYKPNVYFFNEFYEEYLDGYDIAEFYFKSAFTYRQRAAEIADRARDIPGELNPNKDQTLIDFDQQIYTLTNDPYDYQEIFLKLLEELQENRERILALQKETS